MKTLPPILRNKEYEDPSLFLPDNLLRDARRQKNIPTSTIPEVCVLDPDGDIVHNLLSSGTAVRNTSWPCYHTKLYDFAHNGIKYGIIGNAVGASFAVLVAEELFSSGCRLLFSVTSASQICPAAHAPPYFVLIDRALRDEGTSYHYLPASDYATMAENLQQIVKTQLLSTTSHVYFGSSWTTDAPFRETQSVIDFALSENILAVEMEAAALYAFAQARQKPVICIAHVTNQMGIVEGDFEKGEDDGHKEALDLVTALLIKVQDGLGEIFSP